MHWTRQNGARVSFCLHFPFFLGGLLFFDLAIPIFSYIGLSLIFPLSTCIPTPNSGTLSSSFLCLFLFLIIFFHFPKQNSVFGFPRYDSIPGLQCWDSNMRLCAQLLCLILVRVRVRLHSRTVKKLLLYVYACSPFIIRPEQSGLCLHRAWVCPPVCYDSRTDMRAMIILAVLCSCLFPFFFLPLFGIFFFCLEKFIFLLFLFFLGCALFPSVSGVHARSVACLRAVW